MKHIPSWFPAVHFKKLAKEGLAISNAVLTEPYEGAKKRYVSRIPIQVPPGRLFTLSQLAGEGNPCIVSQAIQENSDASGDIKDEDIIAASAGVLYAGKPSDITNNNS